MEEFYVCDYPVSMKLEDARTKFAIDNRMVPTIKSDFPSDSTYAEKLWKCDECERVDSIRHIKVCPGYEELRSDKDLSKDEDLVKYFQDVLNVRYAQNELLH